MWFKLTYSLSSMYLLREDRLPLKVVLAEGDGYVALWKRRIEKVGKADVCCDAVIERSLKPEVHQMFDCLEAGILPQDDPPVVKASLPDGI